MQAMEREGVSPNNSFIEKHRDDEEDQNEDDYSVEEDQFLVKPTPYMLSFPTVAKHKRAPFQEFVRQKMRAFHKVSLIALFVTYALQTAIMIIIRD